ncbi:MAG: hypothetical protein GX221_08090 [Candidatus Riflebacteria bacterium]|nr:hypothetical protein [Candidatus Riflebacteria bacterium]
MSKSRTVIRTRTWRSIILLLIGFGALGIFLLRLIHLQVFQHEQWSRRSVDNHVKKRDVNLKRGNILDRNGNELAISIDTYDIYVYKPEVKSEKNLADKLSSILPMTSDEIQKKLQSSSRYVSIGKSIDFASSDKIKKLRIPGVVLEENYVRFYPQNSLASNIIGFIGKDKTALEGLELYFDKTLKGYPGLEIREDISFSDSADTKVRQVVPPMGGSNITLTIDSYIQHLVESELKYMAERFRPIDATAVVMQPYTGEILAMATYPTYDLNNFSKSKPEERRNRPITDMFDPGSCLKVVTMASAIENNVVDDDSRFYCKGFALVDKKKNTGIRCQGRHGLVDINAALANSCNTAMVQIAQMMNPEDFYRTYKRFGIGEPTGIQAMGEVAGKISPPSKWSLFSMPSLSIGQELSVTALQVTQIYAAIANGGNLMRPLLVKTIASNDGKNAAEFKPEVVRRVLSPELANRLKNMLRLVIDEGGGKLAMLDYYTSAGKTSTAQKYDPKIKSYSRNKLVTSFVGLAPVTKPEIVLFIALNEPQSDGKTAMFGGKIAAPAFSRLAEKILTYMKVVPDKNDFEEIRKKVVQNVEAAEIVSTTASTIVSSEEEIIVGENVPDLSGLSLRGAMLKVASHNLKAIYEGDGVVIGQLPKAGSPLPRTRIMRVKLSPEPQK